MHQRDRQSVLACFTSAGLGIEHERSSKHRVIQSFDDLGRQAHQNAESARDGSAQVASADFMAQADDDPAGC